MRDPDPSPLAKLLHALGVSYGSSRNPVVLDPSVARRPPNTIEDEALRAFIESPFVTDTVAPIVTGRVGLNPRVAQIPRRQGEEDLLGSYNPFRNPGRIRLTDRGDPGTFIHELVHFAQYGKGDKELNDLMKKIIQKPYPEGGSRYERSPVERVARSVEIGFALMRESMNPEVDLNSLSNRIIRYESKEPGVLDVVRWLGKTPQFRKSPINLMSDRVIAASERIQPPTRPAPRFEDLSPRLRDRVLGMSESQRRQLGYRQSPEDAGKTLLYEVGSNLDYLAKVARGTYSGTDLPSASRDVAQYFRRNWGPQLSSLAEEVAVEMLNYDKEHPARADFLRAIGRVR